MRKQKLLLIFLSYTKVNMIKKEEKKDFIFLKIKKNNLAEIKQIQNKNKSTLINSLLESFDVINFSIDNSINPIKSFLESMEDLFKNYSINTSLEKKFKNIPDLDIVLIKKKTALSIITDLNSIVLYEKIYILNEKYIVCLKKHIEKIKNSKNINDNYKDTLLELEIELNNKFLEQRSLESKIRTFRKKSESFVNIDQIFKKEEKNSYIIPFKYFNINKIKNYIFHNYKVIYKKNTIKREIFNIYNDFSISTGLFNDSGMNSMSLDKKTSNDKIPIIEFNNKQERLLKRTVIHLYQKHKKVSCFYRIIVINQLILENKKNYLNLLYVKKKKLENVISLNSLKTIHKIYSIDKKIYQTEKDIINIEKEISIFSWKIFLELVPLKIKNKVFFYKNNIIVDFT